MITSTVSAYQARQNFGKLLDRVNYGRENIVVEKSGEEVAVIISIDEFKNLQQKRELEKEEFFTLLEEMRSASTLDEDQAYALVEEAIKAVRSQSA